MLQAACPHAHADAGVPRVPVLDVAPSFRKPNEDNRFSKLVQLYRDGDSLLAEMRRTQAMLAEARAYLASPGCNAGLGRAQVERLRNRKSRLLARLRAHRIAIHEALVFPSVQLKLPS